MTDLINDNNNNTDINIISVVTESSSYSDVLMDNINKDQSDNSDMILSRDSSIEHFIKKSFERQTRKEEHEHLESISKRLKFRIKIL